MHWSTLAAWLACIAELLLAQVSPPDEARPFHRSKRGDGSCVRLPTVVSWVPTWLHVRTRLAVSLWGTVPLTHGDVAGFAPLAVRRPRPVCLLGAISVRLALQLQKLDDLDVGRDPRGGHLPDVAADVLNRTSIAADWAWVHHVGFEYVLRSGWPVFELLRRIQQHILPEDVERRGPENPWDSRCDAFIRPNDWNWIDSFPRDPALLPFEGMKTLPWYELNKAVKDSGRDFTKVGTLAWATHYLIVAANIFRRPGMAAGFYDDYYVEIPPPDDTGIWTEVFLYKAARYMSNINVVLDSWWPVLAVLGQLTATAYLYAPSYTYVSPFITGLAGPSDDEGARTSMVEAGAHDGSDAVVFATNFPDVDIWAFEAHPAVYAAMNTKIQECGRACQRVYTTECALGAQDQGAVSFFINSPVESNETWGTDSSSSLYRPKFNGSRFTTYQAEPVSVSLTSLRRFAAETDMGQVRFMDLDAEGGELDILLGASDSMLQGAYALKLEIRDESKQLEGVPLFPEVRDWMVTRGFVLVLRSKTDALFVRRDLALI